MLFILTIIVLVVIYYIKSVNVNDTHFLYKTTDYYAKDCEGAIVWNDPELNIQWPEIDGSDGLLVNEKDREASLFKMHVI